MKLKLLTSFLTLCLAGLLAFNFTDDRDRNADVTPTVSNNVTQGDTTPPAGFPFPTKFNWDYSSIPGVNAGTVGACQIAGNYILNRWNSTRFYRYDNTGPGGGPGSLTDSGTYTGAIRDMTIYDGYLWGGKASGTLYKMNPTTLATITTFSTAAQFRAIAWDPNRKGFWGTNFGGNILCYDTAGALRGSVTSALTGKYGMAWDSTSSPDSAFLWVWNQRGTGMPNDLVKYHIGSNTVVATYTFAASSLSGGAEIEVIGGNLCLFLNWQNTAITGYDMGSVGGNNETLVLLHDSTTGTTSNRNRKKADRDTLFKYLPDLVSGYDVMYFDSTTSLSSLSSYKTIIVQETGFDAAISRYLGATARGQLIAWLNSGSAGNKKALLMISADNGYNYSRSGSRGRDLMLSQTMMKYVYQADNSGSRPPASITGITIDVGNARSYVTSAPGGGFWPDGCSAETGGDKLYHYTARGTDDSLAAIGYSATGYVSAILNLDPRYFAGSFKQTLQNMIGYLVSNGGVITGTPTITSNLPDNYSLSQNYPNPFNPSTKINFSIPQAGLVSIVVYDMLGREVQSLVNENLTAGSYIAEFNGAGLSSGTYFYRLQVGEFVQVKRMVLLK